MYRNRCFVFFFCFVCEITRESEKCKFNGGVYQFRIWRQNFMKVPIWPSIQLGVIGKQIYNRCGMGIFSDIVGENVIVYERTVDTAF